MDMARLFLLAGLGVAALWFLADILLLAFAAVLVAVILDGLAGLVCRASPLPRPLALGIVLLVLVSFTVVAFLLLGMRLAADIAFLYDQVAPAFSALGDRLGIADFRTVMEEQLESFAGERGLLGEIAGYTTALLGATASLVLVLVAGVYLSTSPGLYVEGIRQLFPKSQSETVVSALVNAGNALRLWLVGQVITMAVVGVATTIGLYALGVPSALGLGVMAGLLEFIPIVGPLLAALPAILVGLAEGGSMVFWIIGLYILVQQLENNILVPLIQQRTVSLPPVLGLFAILVFGVLFGPLGVLLATPLTVVGFVLVKQLYVRGVLGWPTIVPGERPQPLPGGIDPVTETRPAEPGPPD